MIELNGLHILLTYTCNYECDHCFVWGSPWQRGVLTSARILEILDQARDTGTIREIWFEGGEPFLYYQTLVEGVRAAVDMGFFTGVVSNGYWATSLRDAENVLRPLKEAGLGEIDISSDTYHGLTTETPESVRVHAAAKALGLAVSAITVEPPSGPRDPDQWEPGQPLSGGDVMYRGRAAELLTYALPRQPRRDFQKCPYENLDSPGRLHVDPFGFLHLCQGLVIGNLFEERLVDILAGFEPARHPIAGPLLEGGPAGLIAKFHLSTEPSFVDACHACYAARLILREQFPEILVPEQVYGFM